MTQPLSPHCPFCQKQLPPTPFIPQREKFNIDLGKTFDCSSMGHHHHNAIFRCGRCDIAFLWPLPQAEELAEAYANTVDSTYLNEKEARYRTFRHAFQVLQRFISQGTLLEIGSYYGLFLDVARQAGFEVQGIEPSQAACDYARQTLGLEVIQGSFDRALVQQTFPQGSLWDAVVAWDVLEHVVNPQELLEQVHYLLKPQGIFAFSTLNIANWWPRLLGSRWPWYMQMHLYYFTPRSLERLLEQAGFELLHREPYHHIISFPYFLHKVESLSGWKVPLPGFLQPLAASCFLPFYFGDIPLLVARKRT